MDNFFENEFFKREELSCKGTGILQLSPGFLGELVWLRTVFDKPMVVTSCCRTPEHNKKIGGNPNSLHMTVNARHNTGGTMAIDILTKSDTYREELIRVAKELGWSIGYGNSFIHLDRRIQIGLPQTFFEY